MDEKKNDISPMILAAVGMLKKIESVEEIEVVSDKMYRCGADENYLLGRLGVDILISFKDIGDVKTFLPYGDVEDLIMYPKGGFFAVAFIEAIRRAVEDPDTFLKE